LEKTKYRWIYCFKCKVYSRVLFRHNSPIFLCPKCYDNDIKGIENIDNISNESYVFYDICMICEKETLVCSATGCCQKCDELNIKTLSDKELIDYVIELADSLIKKENI